MYLPFQKQQLYPSEVQISQFYKEEFELARKYAKKLTMVNLSETVSDQSGANNASSSSSSKPSGSSSKSNSDYNPIDYQHQHQQNQHEELKRIMHAQLNRLENQRVSMVRALVEIEDYKSALRIVEKLPPWYLATYPDISLEICKAIDQNVIEPVYRRCNSLSKHFREKYSKSKSARPNESLDELLGTFLREIYFLSCDFLLNVVLCPEKVFLSSPYCRSYLRWVRVSPTTRFCLRS